MCKEPLAAGNRFGRLVLIERVQTGRRHKWLCSCDCGSATAVTDTNLRYGNTKSCGCLNRELTSERNSTHGHTRGYASTKTYEAWQNMRRRCNDASNKRYARYGGRGIRVCDQWNDSFDRFLADMGPCPQGHSIDRIDNNGDYTPENCRWANRSEQMKNRSNARTLEIDGVTKNLCDWAAQYGVKPDTISMRIRYGWTVKDAVTKPVRHLSPRKHL